MSVLLSVVRAQARKMTDAWKAHHCMVPPQHLAVVVKAQVGAHRIVVGARLSFTEKFLFHHLSLMNSESSLASRNFPFLFPQKMPLRGVGFVLAASLCAWLGIGLYFMFVDLGSNLCEMTYMWPGYAPIQLPK